MFRDGATKFIYAVGRSDVSFIIPAHTCALHFLPSSLLSDEWVRWTVIRYFVIFICAGGTTMRGTLPCYPARHY